MYKEEKRNNQSKNAPESRESIQKEVRRPRVYNKTLKKSLEELDQPKITT